MSLNIGKLIDITFTNVTGAQQAQLTAYASATVLVLACRHWAVTMDEAKLRTVLAGAAHEAGIEKTIWQAYVGSCFKVAAKCATHLADDAHYLAAKDANSEEGAVAAMLRVFATNLVTAPAHVRDWGNQAEPGPLGHEAKARARKAKEEEKAKATAGVLAALRATNTKDAAALPAKSDLVASDDPAADVLDALARVHRGADLVLILDAVNRKLAELARIEALDAEIAARQPAHPVAPVTADDVVPADGSALAAQAERVAAADAAKAKPAKPARKPRTAGKGLDALSSLAMSATPPARPNKAA